MAKYVYLDWNVFNKIEQLSELNNQEQLTYIKLKGLIDNKHIVSPYSNAHINDLHRGYLKNSQYTNNHLKNITNIANNLCIVQYWGENRVKWHFREPSEFLNSTIEHSLQVAENYSMLMKGEDLLINTLVDHKNALLKSQALPAAFSNIYSQDPIFNLIFPQSKIDPNILSLCEDLYALHCKMKNDYTFYKHFRHYLNQCKLKFPTIRNLLTKTENSLVKTSDQLTWDDLWNLFKHETPSNKNVDKIVQTFTTMDLKGYRQDERFANLLDDALHVFYAAHCEYFVTLDKRCYDKANQTYTNLKIPTIVISPDDFVTSSFP